MLSFSCRAVNQSFPMTDLQHNIDYVVKIQEDDNYAIYGK